jgi:hypothetical protein
MVGRVEEDEGRVALLSLGGEPPRGDQGASPAVTFALVGADARVVQQLGDLGVGTDDVGAVILEIDRALAQAGVERVRVG